MNFAWYDIIGSIGVATIVLTYVLLQIDRIKSDSLLYSILNAAGASLIIFSLFFNFNFSAFIVEFFWVLISIYGVIRYLLRKS